MSQPVEGALANLLRAMATTCAENQNEIFALRILLKGKHIVGEREFDDTLAIARDVRREILERDGKQEFEFLEDLLRQCSTKRRDNSIHLDLGRKLRKLFYFLRYYFLRYKRGDWFRNGVW